MNIYQHLSSMGESPENCIGKDIITIFKAEGGNYGLGILGRLIATECDSDSYNPLYNSTFEYEFLELEPGYLLSLFAIIHRKAKEREIKIKGKEA